MKGLKYFNIIFTVAVGSSAVISLYWIYKNRVWKPHVDVLQTDYTNGIAKLHINGKPMTLYSNSIVAAGGDWGVMFNHVNGTPDRIELVRNGLVYDILDEKNDI